MDIRSPRGTVGPVGRAHRWARRNPWLAGLGTALAIALLTGTAVSTVLAIQARIKTTLAETETSRANILAKEARAASEESQSKSEALAVQLTENRLKTLEIARKSIEFAGQRGEWEQALAIIDQALQTIEEMQAQTNSTEFLSHLDPVWFRLERIRAFNALLQRARAVEEVRFLQQLPSRGDYEGVVTLWAGDLNLIASGDAIDPLELIQKAIDQGLPAADELYARGLLARDNTRSD